MVWLVEKVKQVEFPYVWLCKSLRTEDKQRGSSFSNVDASLLLLLDPIVFNYSQIFVTCQVLVIQNIKLWCQGIFHVCNCRCDPCRADCMKMFLLNVFSSISWARLCVFIQYHQDCWSCGSSRPQSYDWHLTYHICLLLIGNESYWFLDELL